MKFRASILLFSVLHFSALAQSIPAWQNLMPKPQKIELEKGQFIIDENIQVVLPPKASRRVKLAATKFIRRFTGRTGLFVKYGFPVVGKGTSDKQIIVSYNRNGKLVLREDESYQIDVSSKVVKLQAQTDIGIVFAFETLLQLLDDDANHYYFQNLHIEDKPAFTWRGLMIDVARHFEPVAVIKRNLDAMLVAKMNTFHWHLSDDQGFRIEIKNYPQLTKLASDGQFYTQAQIKDIVKYAADRGIRVIPEIDVPGHATALLTAFPELGSKKMTYKLQRNAGIFNPTLDPTNPKTYVVLDNIFKEMAALFPFEYFHIGGDENEGKDWDANPKIQAFKKQKRFKTNHELQTYFNLKLINILKKYHKKIMGWDEIMTPEIPKSAIIHVWRGKQGKRLAETVKNNYDAVLSNGFYIDLMLPAATHYKASVIPPQQSLSKEALKHILGGETTMWGELVTPLTIDSRIWPRSLAIGERFWTNPKEVAIRNMYQRMFAQSWHLEELGITHLRNKDVILRNLTENQDISGLKLLSDLYEPLKYYTRNKGGTEYQSYSPFTLFADACSADAKQALEFSFLVDDYIKSGDAKLKRQIIALLRKWQQIHQKLLLLTPNPKLKTILPMSESLSVLANDMLYLSNALHKVDKNFAVKLKQDYKQAVKPYNDVALAARPALNKLIAFWLQKRGVAWRNKK